eukprot:4111805-Amphidinium_carterae.1
MFKADTQVNKPDDGPAAAVQGFWGNPAVLKKLPRRPAHIFWRDKRGFMEYTFKKVAVHSASTNAAQP